MDLTWASADGATTGLSNEGSRSVWYGKGMYELLVDKTPVSQDYDHKIQDITEFFLY